MSAVEGQRRERRSTLSEWSDAAEERRGTVAIDMRMVRSSGIGTYLRSLVPRLVKRSGPLSFDLLGDVAELETLGFGGCPKTGLRSATAPIYSVREQFELVRSSRGCIDLFWSPHYNIPLLQRGRMVVTVHDLLHLARPEYVRGPHRRAYARAMFGAVRRRATAIICDSHFTADELVRHTAVDPRLLHVVHLGVDEAWFGAGGADSPHPRPYFLYVGNIKPHKNLRRLVEAFGGVRDRLPHDLILVGKRAGFISGDAGVLAGAQGLGGRLHVTGELTDEQVRSYVSHAAALVLPSLYEGFGLPALEAMASGTPVAASRAASLPEVCGNAALYFDPERVEDLGDRLYQIAVDRSLREDLVAAGRARARLFTWQRCAEQTL
jgi:glycosyltransferase involved in cell wall biosynthesis